MRNVSTLSLLLEHYEQTAEEAVSGMNVRIWKPRGIEPLPAYSMGSAADYEVSKANIERISGVGDDGNAFWFTDNYDAGLWDAQLAMHFEPKSKTLDMYVCSILVRPFSEEARSFYENRMGLATKSRLVLMWDSRDFDAYHGFDVSANPYMEGDYDMYKSRGTKEDIEDWFMTDAV